MPKERLLYRETMSLAATKQALRKQLAGTHADLLRDKDLDRLLRRIGLGHSVASIHRATGLPVDLIAEVARGLAAAQGVTPRRKRGKKPTPAAGADLDDTIAAAQRVVRRAAKAGRLPGVGVAAAPQVVKAGKKKPRPAPAPPESGSVRVPLDGAAAFLQWMPAEFVLSWTPACSASGFLAICADLLDDDPQAEAIVAAGPAGRCEGRAVAVLTAMRSQPRDRLDRHCDFIRLDLSAFSLAYHDFAPGSGDPERRVVSLVAEPGSAAPLTQLLQWTAAPAAVQDAVLHLASSRLTRYPDALRLP